MAGQLLGILLLQVVNPTSPVALIVEILTGIATIIGFYTLVTSKAKLEADLRNEIKNQEEKIEDMEKRFNDLISEFKVVTQQLQAANNMSGRIGGLERSFEKFDRKMDGIGDQINNMKDTFNEKLNQININMERKQDKPR